MRELLIGLGLVTGAFVGFKVLQSRGVFASGNTLGVSESAGATFGATGGKRTSAQRKQAGIRGARGAIDSILGAWEAP